MVIHHDALRNAVRSCYFLSMNATQPAQVPVEIAAPDSDGVRAARIEAFASAYVEHKNYAQAYRSIHDCDGMANQTVWGHASRFAKQPAVIASIRNKLEAAARATIVTVAELLAHQYEIATADVREVVWTSEHACRHCWGADGHYQWRDPEEYDVACARAMEDAAAQGGEYRAPSAAGLYGFTAHRAPNPACETCKGTGQPAVHIADMRSLTGPAAKLIKGVKQDRFGAITVELHDQQKALDACNRIVGAYRDQLTITPPKTAEPMPTGLSAEQVAERYLEMVR